MSVFTNICQACLSTTRELILLDNINNLLLDLKLGFQDPGGGVCWECEALIKKYYKFRNQVCLAQLRLLEKEKLSDIKCLSKLCIFTIKENATKSIEYDQKKGGIFSEHEGKDILLELENVKKEIFDDNFDYKSDYDEPFDHIDDKKSSISKLKSLDKYYSESKNNDIKPIILGDGLSSSNSSEIITISAKNTVYIKEKCPFKNDNFDTKSKIETVILTDEEVRAFREKQINDEAYRSAKFKCEPCLIGFGSKRLLSSHCKDNHDEDGGKYACDICSLIFCTITKAWEHRKGHYLSYKCKICKRVELKMWRIWKHCQKEHSGHPVKHRCKRCSTNFKSKEAYDKHMEKGHMHKCFECGEIFHKKMDLWKHNKAQNHNAPPRKCEVCDKEFKGRQGLFIHMRTHHKQADEAAYCVECGIQYNNVYGYRQHLRTSLKHVDKQDLRHPCPHCEMRFAAPAPLERHITAKHTDRYDFKCDQCERMFKTSVTLRKHILRKHIRGGVLPRDKVCDVCGKAFKAKITLQQHMNTHTGARPYACDACGATFSYSGALYKHTQLVHNKGKDRRREGK